MSDKGNGTDIGQVLAIVRGLADGQIAMRAELRDLTTGQQEFRAELHDHSRKLDEHGRRLDDLAAGLAGLRQAMTEYHATVLGHRVLFSQFEERVRRIERHLELPPAAA